MDKVTFANCVKCKTLFVKKSPTQKYCKECAAIVAKEYNTRKKREYYDKIRVRKKKKKEQETVEKHCKHKDCKYRSRVSNYPCCDYILAIGEPRGCAISKCDKYESGKREKAMISLPRKEVMV